MHFITCYKYFFAIVWVRFIFFSSTDVYATNGRPGTTSKLVRSDQRTFHVDNDVVHNSRSLNIGGKDPQQLQPEQYFSINEVRLAGIYDALSFDWGEELIDFTIDLVNNHSDGWFDDVLNDGTILKWTLGDSACDSVQAALAYWDIHSKHPDSIHGIVGCRCSSASIQVATLGRLEGLPQVSFASTSSELSNDDKYPLFSRVVGPDDRLGLVGGLVSMLKELGWSRVGILQTQTSYSSSVATEFQNAWSENGLNGEIAYSNVIRVMSEGEVDLDSARIALESIPTDDPSINTRVILLFAHNRHANQILKLAHDTGFQPSTIWIGGDGWANRHPVPPVPGYIGLTPFRNRGPVYQDFLQRLQTHQESQGREPWKELPDYAAEYMVDSVLAMAMALSAIPHDERQNGELVAFALRNITFDGITGPVGFTSTGDRRDPRYSVFNYQPTNKCGNNGTDSDSNGDGHVWKNIGSAEPGNVSIDIAQTYFARLGCGQQSAPPDKYAQPLLPVWATISLVVVAVLICTLTALYIRARRTIDNVDKEIQKEIEAAKEREAKLMAERFSLEERPETWSDTDDILVEVAPNDAKYSSQYWTMLDRLRSSMPDAHISKLWRVQNSALWSWYSFHKKNMELHGGRAGANEQSVFHGTKLIDPSVIYNDRNNGFMIAFASEGLFGRGLYFAAKAKISHKYAHRPGHTSHNSSIGSERGEAMKDEFEFFSATLLAGDDVFMDRKSDDMKKECRALFAPPLNEVTKERYSSVRGKTRGSIVWVMYENGKAYPDYLVRYYLGKRDPTRTPFESMEEATDSLKLNSEVDDTLEKPNPNTNCSLTGGSSAKDSSLDSIEKGIHHRHWSSRHRSSKIRRSSSNQTKAEMPFTWEYRSKQTWKPYYDDHQEILEAAYLKYKSNPNELQSEQLYIKSNRRQYVIDLKNMTQTNTERKDQKQRKIRRYVASRDISEEDHIDCQRTTGRVLDKTEGGE